MAANEQGMTAGKGQTLRGADRMSGNRTVLPVFREALPHLEGLGEVFSSSLANSMIVSLPRAKSSEVRSTL